MSNKLLRNFTYISIIVFLTILGSQANDHKKPFGLVSKLPQDTEILFGLTHFEDFANEIGKSNTWKKIAELLELQAGLIFLMQQKHGVL